jgi:signal transduction histidine kinase
MQICCKHTCRFAGLAGLLLIMALSGAFFAATTWALIVIAATGVTAMYLLARFFFNKALSLDTDEQVMEKLGDAYQEQKDFIANSSHELRTPLTSITGQIEVALLQERTPEEYQQVLQSLLEDIRNLNLLTNRLLLLTRSTGDIPADRLSPVRIDDLLWRSVAEIGKRNPEYTVQIHFEPSIEGEHHFTVLGNEQLLITALNNILENGCKYSVNQRVDVSLSVTDEQIRLDFNDTGIGIPQDELAMIFQPFYRASNVKKRGGHGIGLSMVDKIVTAHGGNITISSELNRGTEVAMTLPLANPA